jgi:site-specific recombinase XerC
MTLPSASFTDATNLPPPTSLTLWCASAPASNLIPEIGRTKLKQLSRATVRKLYREKKQTGLSSRTVEYIHVTLHKALKNATEDGLISTNPAQGLKLPQRDEDCSSRTGRCVA